MQFDCWHNASHWILGSLMHQAYYFINIIHNLESYLRFNLPIARDAIYCGSIPISRWQMEKHRIYEKEKTVL